MTETTPETARLTADVVLFAKHDRQLWVLMIRRGWEPFSGWWALPGGHVDPNEDTDVAARRELAEETGLHLAADALTLMGAYAEPDRDPRGRYVAFAYTAYADSLQSPNPGDDASAACWLPVEHLLYLDEVAFDHKRIIRNAYTRHLIRARKAEGHR
jgi:8-oxo-dGTP diphosphatase